MDAVAWAREVLDGLGHDVLGVSEVHRRAWSTVWRVDTGDGAFFLKTAPEGVSAEPALLEVLARHGVPHAQRPIAVSGRHVLLPDGGGTVRDAPDRSLLWRDVLVHYAELQRASAPLADELVRAGVPDLRMDVLPTVAGAVIDRWAPDRAAELRPLVRDTAAELADLMPAATVEHSDLHDGNAFARGAVPFDWGDACVSHPFLSLLVAADEGVPGAVDAYVAAFSGGADAVSSGGEDAGSSGCADVASDPVVRRAVALAGVLAAVPRALSWQRAIDAAGDAMPVERRGAARAWVLRLGDA